MGYIRFAHFAAGYVVTIAFIGRIYWAIVGNSHARELFYPKVFRKAWWKEVWHEIRWYSFMEKTPKKYVGHNPLAQLGMFVLFVLGIIFMIVTGFALYSEGLGQGTAHQRVADLGRAADDQRLQRFQTGQNGTFGARAADGAQVRGEESHAQIPGEKS